MRVVTGDFMFEIKPVGFECEQNMATEATLVLQVAAATSSTSAGADFLNEKRKAKIRSLVEHYVSQRKHEQSAAAK